MREKETCETILFEKSSGNVFADMGCVDAEEKLAKADIAINIARVIKERKLTQVEAAKLLGIDQPSVSRLLKGQLREFSTSRLLKFLPALSQDVEIRIKPASSRRDYEQTGRIFVAYGG